RPKHSDPQSNPPQCGLDISSSQAPYHAGSRGYSCYDENSHVDAVTSREVEGISHQVRDLRFLFVEFSPCTHRTSSTAATISYPTRRLSRTSTSACVTVRSRLSDRATPAPPSSAANRRRNGPRRPRAVCYGETILAGTLVEAEER
ncbi:hypothetical protein K438DRAFT_2018583, partial [Mycena galopus ATCC 62051]